VAINCGAIPETLLESELFGHKRGAFTGAVSDKLGKVDREVGGTLLLDEVGEISPSMQAKLLRLVETRAYEAVGDPTPRTVDARLVAATNRDLPELMREGQFREDLYYRLGVVELTLPPLRARPADLADLAALFLDKFSQEHGKLVESLDPEVERVLVAYSWPGNIRELRHVLERAVLLCPGRTIRPDHLPPRLLDSPGATSEGAPIVPLSIVEEDAIRRALALGRPLEETARLLGIDPSTLWRKRKKHGL
jgi:NtrC-family two-component system response regulator AlgB